MNDKEKEEIKKKVVWQSCAACTPSSKIGQSWGEIDTSATLVLNELGINIHVECYRSQLKNRELAMEMLDTALNKL